MSCLRLGATTRGTFLHQITWPIRKKGRQWRAQPWFLQAGHKDHQPRKVIYRKNMTHCIRRNRALFPMSGRLWRTASIRARRMIRVVLMTTCQWKAQNMPGISKKGNKIERYAVISLSWLRPSSSTTGAVFTHSGTSRWMLSALWAVSSTLTSQLSGTRLRLAATWRRPCW